MSYYGANPTTITVAQTFGRWEVCHHGQTISLHYTSKEAREAAFNLHRQLWPMDAISDVQRWYGHFPRES